MATLGLQETDDTNARLVKGAAGTGQSCKTGMSIDIAFSVRQLLRGYSRAQQCSKPERRSNC